MSKQRLYLHIGMGKTGTTAIQQWLCAHADFLASQGIAYPEQGRVSCAHHLISPHVPEYLQSVWQFLEVEDWAPALTALDQPTLLMSSELIAWAGPGQVSDFCTRLQRWFDLRVVVYLRRQDELLMAGYNQRVKAGVQFRPLAEILARRLEQLDYEAILAPWVAAVGERHLTLRPYERGQLEGGDVRRDFLIRVLGLRDLAGLDFPMADSNPRLDPAALEMQRLINVLLADREAALRHAPALAAYPGDGAATAALLSGAQRREILAQCEAANRRLARRFLGDQAAELFLDPWPSASAPAARVDDAALAAVAGHLRRHDLGAFHALREEVSASQGNPDAEIKAAAQTLALAMDAAHRVQVIPPQGVSGGREAILHLGMPKTGTTSIQEALYAHRGELLSRHRILYPSVEANHTNPLCTMFLPDPRTHIAVRMQGVETAEAAEALRQDYFERMEAELRGGDWDRLLLSAEGLSNLRTPQLMQIAEWLRGHVDRWRVLYWVRHPVPYTASVLQELLKGGRTIEEMLGRLPLTNYKGRLSNAFRAFGRRYVELGSFEAARAEPGGLVAAFCRRLGLDEDTALAIAAGGQTSNPSMSLLSGYLLDYLNRHLPLFVDGTLNPARSRIPTGLDTGLPGPRFDLPQAVRRRVREASREEIRWLNQAFGTELYPDLFDDDEATGSGPADIIHGWFYRQ